MTAFYVVIGAAAAAALAWIAARLLRRPGNIRLYALLALVVLYVVSWPFGVAGSGSGAAWVGLQDMDARAVEHAMRVAAAYCLLCFILSTVGEARRARRSAIRQLVPMVLVVAGMLVAASAIPAPLGAAAAALADGDADGSGPVGVTAIAVFYLLENLYYGYVFAVALRWTDRYRRVAEQPLRRGLWITGAGCATLVVATAFLVASNVVRWAGTLPPPIVPRVGLVLLALGLVLFLAGLVYPSVRTGIATASVVREHRRTYRELGPLWEMLHEAFPQDALPPEPGRRRMPTASRRYYRRVIECRDGLVRLSPYLRETGADGFDGGSVPSADALVRALRAHREGMEVGSAAVTVAGTEGRSLADDARRLVAVSRELRDADV